MRESERRYRQSEKYRLYRKQYDPEYNKRQEVKLKHAFYCRRYYQEHREKYLERNRQRVRSIRSICDKCSAPFTKWDYLKVNLCTLCRRRDRLILELGI